MRSKLLLGLGLVVFAVVAYWQEWALLVILAFYLIVLLAGRRRQLPGGHQSCIELRLSLVAFAGYQFIELWYTAYRANVLPCCFLCVTLFLFGATILELPATWASETVLISIIALAALTYSAFQLYADLGVFGQLKALPIRSFSSLRILLPSIVPYRTLSETIVLPVLLLPYTVYGALTFSNLFLRILNASAAMLLVDTIIAAHLRGPLLALAFCVCGSCLWIWLQAGRKKRLAIYLGIVLVSLAAAAMIGIDAKGALTQFDSVSQRRSGSARLEAFSTGTIILRDHPLLGVGPGNYGLFVRRVHTELADQPTPDRPLNCCVALLCSYGAIGGLLVAVILLYCCRSMPSFLRSSYRNSGDGSLLDGLVALSLMSALVRDLSYNSIFVTVQSSALFIGGVAFLVRRGWFQKSRLGSLELGCDG